MADHIEHDTTFPRTPEREHMDNLGLLARADLTEPRIGGLLPRRPLDPLDPAAMLAALADPIDPA
jgi:hypothetical protein